MNPNYKFMMWDWDEGQFYVIPKKNTVEAIYYAWNYEFDVHEVETEELIFTGQETNEFNSDMLEKYGLRVIDGNRHRHLQNIETGEVYKASWQQD
ncbi:hypothetical protein AB1283_00925 [Bacillus sp. S13(2024)]|uniref:hypothetical protein n=1 Tax=Bacillus sp. S13(2024) TaxID=3162885 RepID=UPI003D206937